MVCKKPGYSVYGHNSTESPSFCFFSKHTCFYNLPLPLELYMTYDIYS